MPIEKVSFEKTMREIRKLYKRHVDGKINASSFTDSSKKLISKLEKTYNRSLVDKTAQAVISELESHQTQFGLSLSFSTDVYYYNGKLRVSVRILKDKSEYGEIFIGPKVQWDKITVFTPEEGSLFGFGPNLYTKRMMKRWTRVEDFDFPSYLHDLKERIERREAEEKERRDRIAAGLPEYPKEDIPF